MNHLWQSTLFAGLAALLTLALRGNPARARYWLWFAASAKFLIPFSLLVALGQQIHLPAATSTAVQIPVLLEQIAQPITASPAPIFIQAAPVAISAPTRSVEPRFVLLAIWLCGFLFVTLRWARAWRILHSIQRSGRAVDLGLPIQTIVSSTAQEPGVFGVFRPVLLLPDGILAALEPAELQAVLLHELQHVRHRDNLFASIHMAIEAVFWFHPLVWWIGRRMIAERERACDQAVLQAGNAPSAYAEAILKVCGHYLESPLACAAGVTGADLKQRIREIMQHRIVRGLNAGKRVLLLSAGALAIVMPLSVGIVVNLIRPPFAKAQAIPQASPQALPVPLPAATAPRTPAPAPPADIPQVAEEPWQRLERILNQTATERSLAPDIDRLFLLSLLTPKQPPECGHQITKYLADEAGRFTGVEVVNPPPFEVVSIRVHVDPPRPAVVTAGNVPAGFRTVSLSSANAVSGNQVTLQNVSLDEMIADAYCVENYQVVLGVAKNVFANQKYDLIAKVPDGIVPSKDQIRWMLQGALADRFHLTLHRSLAEAQVYRLVIAKSGVKMRTVADGDTGAAEPNSRRQSFASLVSVVARRVDRRVVDETWLYGTFEYSLDFMRDIQDASDTSAIFTAVQEHLGLRLDPAKAPFNALIVDAATKPTEN